MSTAPEVKKTREGAAGPWAHRATPDGSSVSVFALVIHALQITARRAIGGPRVGRRATRSFAHEPATFTKLFGNSVCGPGEPHRDRTMLSSDQPQPTRLGGGLLCPVGRIFKPR